MNSKVVQFRSQEKANTKQRKMKIVLQDDHHVCVPRVNSVHVYATAVHLPSELMTVRYAL